MFGFNRHNVQARLGGTSLGLVALMLAVSACGPREDAVSETTSYPRLAAKWDTPTIAVCWEEAAMAKDYDTGRALVEAKIKEQYEERTVLRFPGWKACLEKSKGMRITVADAKKDNPHTLGLGRTLDGVSNGMELNFTFVNWSPSCQKSKEYCIKTIGAHEFGHAIGLAHEQNRSDRPKSCTDKPQGSNGDTMVGEWDIDSIMNYCNPKYSNDGELSTGDIAGIEALYGKRR